MELQVFQRDGCTAGNSQSSSSNQQQFHPDWYTSRKSKEVFRDWRETAQVQTELFHFSFASQMFSAVTLNVTCAFPGFFEFLFHLSLKLGVIFMSV